MEPSSSVCGGRTAADVRERRSQMPAAAMLPRPAPTPAVPAPAAAPTDWSFQNAVGVDCSAPEPRCIWLAVLRGIGASPPTFPSMPLGGGDGSSGGHGYDETNRVCPPPQWPRVRSSHRRGEVVQRGDTLEHRYPQCTCGCRVCKYCFYKTWGFKT